MLDVVDLFVVEETPRIFGNAQRGVTLNLTRSGLDADGKSMKPLTKGYKKFKVGLSLPGKADMRLFGDMMRSLRMRGNVLGFDDNQLPKVLGNLEHRKFFDIHPTAVRYGEQDTIKEFNRL